MSQPQNESTRIPVRSVREDETLLQTPAPASHTPNPERRGIRKGIYLAPTAFTLANICAGFYAVMGALRGFQLVGIGGAEEIARAGTHFNKAALAIGLAVVFDSLDGRVARMTKTTTEIGVQFDSIADVLTFGIAPAVLVYAWSTGSVLVNGSDAHKLGWFLSFMYLICGAFRLARFNVQATRPRPLAEGTSKVDKKSFVGLPIPAAAALLAGLVHFAPQPLKIYDESVARTYCFLVMLLVAALAALMVSTIRYTSFKSVGAGSRSTRFALIALASVGMLAWLYSRYVFLAIMSVYVLHGVIARLWSLLFRRRQTSPA